MRVFTKDVFERMYINHTSFSVDSQDSWKESFSPWGWSTADQVSSYSGLSVRCLLHTSSSPDFSLSVKQIIIYKWSIRRLCQHQKPFLKTEDSFRDGHSSSLIYVACTDVCMFVYWVLALKCLWGDGDCYGLNCALLNSCAEIPILSTSECDLIWKSGRVVLDVVSEDEVRLE